MSQIPPDSPLARYLPISEIARPPEQTAVDWSVEPPKYKRYPGAPLIPLGYAAGRGTSEIVALGRLLADTYGFTRLRRKEGALHNRIAHAAGGALPSVDLEREPFKVDLLRPVPSGGNLFPCELYALIGLGQAAPPGLYYYDGAHHALVALRPDVTPSALGRLLARADAGDAAITLLIGCRFWKNAFKYGEFSYRLQSLDSGVVAGQSCVVGTRHGFTPVIHYQFLDAELNALVGLDPAHESIFAVVTLHAGAAQRGSHAPAPPLLAPAPQPAEPIDRWPSAAALQYASCMPGREAFRAPGRVPPLDAPIAAKQEPIAAAPPELHAGIAQRRSASRQFTGGPVARDTLARLLAAVGGGYANDIDLPGDRLQHTKLWLVALRVEGLTPGVYCYDAPRQALELCVAGDFRQQFQAAQGWMGYNMYHVAACLVPAGSYNAGYAAFGERWYRMQNMEAGIAIERAYLAAAALELGCHTTLECPVAQLNALLRLPAGQTSLANILLGTSAPSGRAYEQAL